jgi:murein DD-endopeptidase MepM/ murein hydrolase activator NlpD
MTADIIANQHVSKRRKPYKNTNRPVVFGNGANYRQIRLNRRKNKPEGSPFRRGEFPPVSEGKRQWPPAEKKLKTGFSIPVPSLATIAIVMGILLVSLVALKWDGWPIKKGVSFLPDSSGQSPIVNYADTGALSILTERLLDASPIAVEVRERDIPLDLTENFRWIHYVVARGDTVSGIALKFKLSMDAVIASNDISNARRLPEGKVLRIPNMDGIPHKIAKGDSISGISTRYNVPLEVILDVNDIKSDVIKEGDILFIPGARMAPEALRLSLGELFMYPVSNVITSRYGWRTDPFTGQQSYHQGIDIRGDTGTTVKAAMDGVVSDIGTVSNYGNYIIIDHSNGYQTLYAHLSAFSCRLGQRVKQGEKVGEVGNTGRSTGPHLHFGVFKNGKSVNPLDLLN